MRHRPIGFFDSGVGGLTVVRALKRVLPLERVVYIADTAHLPYGDKAAHEIRQYSAANVDYLLAHGVKAIVVACNTSSSLALPLIRQRAGVAVVGMIEPVARAVPRLTRRRRVGVLATRRTVESGAYTRTIHSIDPGIAVFEQACPKLVPLIEAQAPSREIEAALCEYLPPLAAAGCDTLILGCTHYPLVIPEIQRLWPSALIVDPAVPAIEMLRDMLGRQGLLAEARLGEDLYLSTGKPPTGVLVEQPFRVLSPVPSP